MQVYKICFSGLCVKPMYVQLVIYKYNTMCFHIVTKEAKRVNSTRQALIEGDI